jgi:predicted dehydrogenase
MAALSGAAAARGAQGGKKLRYGVVGSGNRSRGNHFPILRDYVSEVEIHAICDITPENLAQGLTLCPGAKGYSDYREMLAQESNLDAVLVVVPNYMHAEITIAALNAGKHVLVEKPMALSLADADRMIEAARRNKRMLQVGQQMRYSQAYARMRELIGQGVIGDLSYVFASLFRGDWNPASWKYTDQVTGQKTNWRFLTKTAGSSLLEDGIHELDVIHWLVDSNPVRIQATGGNKVFLNRETIDHAGLLVEFANGCQLTFGYTVFSPRLPEARGLRLIGSKAEMRLEGTRESPVIVIHPFQGQPTHIPADTERPEPVAGASKPHLPDPDTYREHKAFAGSIREGTPVFADGQVGKDAIHISLAAERSLRQGRIFDWQNEAAI